MEGLARGRSPPDLLEGLARSRSSPDLQHTCSTLEREWVTLNDRGDVEEPDEELLLVFEVHEAMQAAGDTCCTCTACPQPVSDRSWDA